jgi:uncharacterized protein YpmB
MVLKSKFPLKNIIVIFVLIIILIITLIFIKPKDPKSESELKYVPPEIRDLDKKQRASFKNRNTKHKFYNDRIDDDKNVIFIQPTDTGDIIVYLDDDNNIAEKIRNLK